MMSYEKKQTKTIFWRIIQLLLLIMAQKNDNAAAAISLQIGILHFKNSDKNSGDTERREKNGDLFVIEKNLKYSCTCIVHEKAYGEEYIQSEWGLWKKNKEIHKKKINVQYSY